MTLLFLSYILKILLILTIVISKYSKKKNYFIFWPKNWIKDIMIFDFIPFWSWLNLLILFYKNQNDFGSSGVSLEVVKYLKYRNNISKY